MDNAKKVKHIIKNLPANWNLPTIISSDITFDKLLPALIKIDEDMRRRPDFSQSNGLTLLQVKDFLACEFDKYKRELSSSVSAASQAAVAAVSGHQPMPPSHQIDRRAQQLIGNECQICGRVGHTAENCFKRYNTGFNNARAVHISTFNPRGSYQTNYGQQQSTSQNQRAPSGGSGIQSNAFYSWIPNNSQNTSPATPMQNQGNERRGQP